MSTKKTVTRIALSPGMVDIVNQVQEENALDSFAASIRYIINRYGKIGGETQAPQATTVPLPVMPSAPQPTPQATGDSAVWGKTKTNQPDRRFKKNKERDPNAAPKLTIEQMCDAIGKIELKHPAKIVKTRMTKQGEVNDDNGDKPSRNCEITIAKDITTPYHGSNGLLIPPHRMKEVYEAFQYAETYNDALDARRGYSARRVEEQINAGDE